MVVSKFGKRTSQRALSEELVYLCCGGNPEQITELIKAGSDPSHRDGKGKTALQRAAKAGFFRTIEVLLGSGADLKISDDQGETPLFDAVRSTIKNFENKKQTLQLLVRSGSNPYHENLPGQTVNDVLKTLKKKWTDDCNSEDLAK